MKQLKNVHRTACLIFANTLVVFLLLNLSYWALSYLRHSETPKPRQTQDHNHPGYPRFLLTRKVNSATEFMRNQYQRMTLDLRAYQQKSPAEIHQIIDDVYQREPYLFSSYNLYTSAPQRSPTLNVFANEFGFTYRSNSGGRQIRRKGSRKVYMFGGSTLHGVHLPDKETIPAQLERELNHSLSDAIAITNHGHCGYSWFQEMVLFREMLQARDKPEIAIFFDGVNTGWKNGRAAGIPLPVEGFERVWNVVRSPDRPKIFPPILPILRKINQFTDSKRQDNETQIVNESPMEPLTIATSYLRTIKMIRALGKEYGVKTLFFLQPNKAYLCQNEKYRFHVPKDYHALIQGFYGELESYASKDFHNLSKLCQDLPNDLLFVDDLHYNSLFSNHIAKHIAEKLVPYLIPTTPTEEAILPRML